MNNKIWISKIQFHNGQEFEFNKNDIVVFLGAHNCGKSLLLKEINSLLINQNSPTVLVRNVQIQQQGDAKELIENISANAKLDKKNVWQGYQYSCPADKVESIWDNLARNGCQQLYGYFANYQPTEQRFSLVNPPKNISLTDNIPTHPIHLVQNDIELQTKINLYFNQVFGQQIVFDIAANGTVPLYVTNEFYSNNGKESKYSNYSWKNEYFSQLHQQGNGMRSFIGLLLNTLATHYSVQLIDDPDAFLHPAQSKLMGKKLALELSNYRQIFCSTHSEDFLKGVLDCGAKNIKIVRINREENKFKIYCLKNKKIKKIWQNSLLKYSNIIKGFFTEKVVICESDTDCLFYSTILDVMSEKNHRTALDLFFTYCGGKHRMPIITSALKSLGVPMQVIVDIDALRDEYLLKKLVIDLGGDWQIIAKIWWQLKNSIEDGVGLNKKYQRTEKSACWEIIKKHGKQAILEIYPKKKYYFLIEYLYSIGLLIVEVGEIESFVPKVKGHGSKWVLEVIDSNIDFVNAKELIQARQFIKKLIN